MGTTMTNSTAPNLRILRIFEVIADAGRAMTPTEINEQLDWPKQSLHRLCQTLIAEGYLVKQARRLHPTKRLLGLAAGLTQHAAGQTTRHQVLQNIARETGETVNFVRPEIKGMIYADRVETNWPFGFCFRWERMCRFIARQAEKPISPVFQRQSGAPFWQVWIYAPTPAAPIEALIRLKMNYCGSAKMAMRSIWKSFMRA
jgi:hypothetical protein